MGTKKFRPRRGSGSPPADERRKGSGEQSRSLQNATFVVLLTLAIGISGAAASWVSALRDEPPALDPTPGTTTASGAGAPAPELRPRPAPTDNPPVLIESVSRLRSTLPGHDFALPAPAGFDPARLRTFNESTYPNSRQFGEWYDTAGAAASEFGLFTLTVRGNWPEKVRLADIVVDKNCGAPLRGSYFQGYSQGAGETIRLGIDLDDPNPVPEEMALTTAGLTPTGDDYFAVNTVELAQGESETLTVGAFTKLYACSFSLRLVLATSRGAFFQSVDDQGRSFRVTARARPTATGRIFSGYRSAYVQSPKNPREPGRPVWQAVDTMTYRGN